MKHYIYALLDPRDSRIRYVGATNSDRRLSTHLRDAKIGRKCNVSSWVRGLLAEGLRPVQVVFQTTSSLQERHRAEMYFIRKFQSVEAPLLNMTVGGPGNTRKLKLYCHVRSRK